MLNTNRTSVIVLAALSAVLMVISITLSVILYRQRRFVPVNGNDPYIMFDTRTAQACWSGPPDVPTDVDATDPSEKYRRPPSPQACADDPFKEFGGRMLGCPKNPHNLPFCKDLN